LNITTGGDAHTDGGTLTTGALTINNPAALTMALLTNIIATSITGTGTLTADWHRPSLIRAISR